MAAMSRPVSSPMSMGFLEGGIGCFIGRVLAK